MVSKSWVLVLIGACTLLPALAAPRAQEEPEKQQQESAVAVLQRTVARMQDTARRLTDGRIDQTTVRNQTDILQSLDRLIEAAEQLPQSQQPSPAPPSNRPPNDPPPPSDGTGDADQSSDPQSRREDQRPQDASDTTGRAEAVAESPAERRRVIVREVWGHLPPALQQRLMNANDERPLPKYERLVEKYFEALAEKTSGRRTPRRRP